MELGMVRAAGQGDAPGRVALLPDPVGPGAIFELVTRETGKVKLHVQSLGCRPTSTSWAEGGKMRTLPVAFSNSTVQPVFWATSAAALIRAGEGDGAGIS